MALISNCLRTYIVLVSRVHTGKAQGRKKISNSIIMIAINICQQVRQKTEAMKNFSQSVDFHFDVRSATKFTLYPKL